jgi:hypothetical protein
MRTGSGSLGAVRLHFLVGALALACALGVHGVISLDLEARLVSE